MSSGTVLLCTQNLAVSGANQVLLTLVKAGLFDGNVVLITPKGGPFETYFQELGVSVRVGWSIERVFFKLPDIKYAVCNTIMTAHLCVTISSVFNTPAVWIVNHIYSFFAHLIFIIYLFNRYMNGGLRKEFQWN